MSQNKPSQITLDFIDDIQTREKRIVNFLGEEIIVNKNVFPVDSPFSYSSEISAKNIYSGLSSVLDIGTGTGVQSIIAAKKGAKSVLAIDIDEGALDNAKENVERLGLQNIIEIRKSDLFENIKNGEKFDVIIAQLPLADFDYSSPISHFLFDHNFSLHKRFLQEAKKHLNQNAKIFIPSGDIGNEKLLLELIKEYNYDIHDIKEEIVNNVRWKLYILTDAQTAK